MLPRRREWHNKHLHVEIIVRHGRSCRADACGVAACFGRAMDLGANKQVRFENKKNDGVRFGICFNIKVKFKKKSPWMMDSSSPWMRSLGAQRWNRRHG